MSTPPRATITYPQEPTPLPVPSNAPLTYGDLVQLVNQYGIWIAAPTTNWSGGSNPTANVSQASSQSSAQNFMIVNALGGVPLTSSGLPAPVNYNDIVTFIAYPSYTGLTGYAPVLSSQSKLVLQQAYLTNKRAQWQLQPASGQSGALMLPGNPNAVGNEFYMKNIGSGHYYNNDSKDTYWSESAHNGDIYQIQTLNSVCGQIADCPTGAFCWSNKCYPNQAPPYAQSSGNADFVTNAFNSICNGQPQNTNNLEQPFCYGTCLAQAPNSGPRTTCDSNYQSYCKQVWGTSMPPGSNVCACTQAAANNIIAPECFWPFCASGAANNYLTSGQQEALNSPGACSATCVNIFYCQADQGSCNIAQNTFDQACGGTANNPCGQNGQTCQPGLTCVSGTCQQSGSGGCTQNSDCPQGQQCQSGNCVISTSCTQTSDCPVSMVCYQNQCILPNCQSNSDCNSPQVCQNYQCVNTCSQNSDCPSNMVCTSGSCVTPPPPPPPNKFIAFIKANAKYFAIGGAALVLLIIILVVINMATKKKSTTSAK